MLSRRQEHLLSALSVGGVCAQIYAVLDEIDPGQNGRNVFEFAVDKPMLWRIVNDYYAANCGENPRRLLDWLSTNMTSAITQKFLHEQLARGSLDKIADRAGLERLVINMRRCDLNHITLRKISHIVDDFSPTFYGNHAYLCNMRMQRLLLHGEVNKIVELCARHKFWIEILVNIATRMTSYCEKLGNIANELPRAIYENAPWRALTSVCSNISSGTGITLLASRYIEERRAKHVPELETFSKELRAAICACRE